MQEQKPEQEPEEVVKLREMLKTLSMSERQRFIMLSIEEMERKRNGKARAAFKP